MHILLLKFSVISLKTSFGMAIHTRTLFSYSLFVTTYKWARALCQEDWKIMVCFIASNSPDHKTYSVPSSRNQLDQVNNNTFPTVLQAFETALPETVNWLDLGLKIMVCGLGFGICVESHVFDLRLSQQCYVHEFLLYILPYSGLQAFYLLHLVTLIS